MQSSMLTTQEFIKRKCSQDHFTSKVQSPNKHSSVYTSDYKFNKKSLHELKQNCLLGRNRNQALKSQSSYLYAPTSMYRNSFEKNEIQRQERYHEKPSYFLKLNNFQPINSSYNRSTVLKIKDQNTKLQIGKPRSDNLFVPKYCRMSTNSLYKDSYGNYATKLPSVHKQKPQILKTMGQEQN